jgi:hypothetical protein
MWATTIKKRDQPLACEAEAHLHLIRIRIL